MGKWEYRIAKFVLLAGAVLYWVLGNSLFSDLHETDFHTAIGGAMVCLFASTWFLIGFACLVVCHHIRILYEKIDDRKV